MSFLETVRAWSSVLLFLLNAGFAAIIWIVRRSLATKEDIEAVGTAITKIEQRVVSLEQAREAAPTKDDLNALRLEMERMRGDMRAYTAELRGERDKVAAEISAVEGLLGRTERMVTMVTEHLLSTAR